jgi:hypothetical protein
MSQASMPSDEPVMTATFWLDGGHGGQSGIQTDAPVIHGWEARE